jgi:hypothetical protein
VLLTHVQACTKIICREYVAMLNTAVVILRVNDGRWEGEKGLTAIAQIWQ